MAKPRSYFTVLVRDGATAPWCIHFGDYSGECARQEARDIVEGGDYRRSDVRVMVTGDTQAEIDRAVAERNGHAPEVFETDAWRLVRNVFGQWKLTDKATCTYEFVTDKRARQLLATRSW